MEDQKPQGIPISEFAAQSPENAAIVEQLKRDLDSGAISMCACMGPAGDDLYCPCEMARRGLKSSNEWTPEKIAELEAALLEFSAAEIGKQKGKGM